MEDIEIIEVESIKVLGLRRTGPYTDIPKLFMELYQHAMANGLKLGGPAYYISHESSEEEARKAQEEGNADIEVAFPIEGDAEDSGDIRCYELPGSRMVKLKFKGPYDQMSLLTTGSSNG